MTETTSVTDLLKKFNEKPPMVAPITPKKPVLTPKPKPQENGSRNNNHNDTQQVNSPAIGTKPTKLPPKPINRPKELGKFCDPPNLAEGIKAVKLKRAPPPKTPGKPSTTPSEETELSKVLMKRNSRKNFPEGDKENTSSLVSNGSVKIRSDSVSSTNSSESSISNTNSIVLPFGAKPQRAELPSLKECGLHPPKRAKPPVVRLPKPTQHKPKPQPEQPPPVIKPKPARQVSLIQPTSDSEEEIEEDIYDDTEATPAPPPLANMPNYQPAPKVVPTPTAIDFGDVYDMVGDTGEDIYEAVETDVIEARMPPSVNNTPQETQEDKAKEKQRKELEKQKKKEEEKKEKERIKKEREEKKKREKEEKDNRKKFNIKGDIVVLREMVVTEAYTATDKLDIGCYSGEQLELIREDNNPQDRLLVRNKQGVYGYVQIYCVDNAEPQELYDDVAARAEEIEEEVYDMCS